MNKKLVVKLLLNPKARRVGIRLLKSPTVRRIIIKQVKRQLRRG